MNGVEEAVEDGEVDLNAAVPKVHVRGVNSLSTTDVEDYAREYYEADFFRKVEWIDDASANLVYDTEMAALEALQAFSAEDRTDPLELRTAKRLSTHPEIELFVRQAVESDVKVKNAHLHSRYYLDNPEYDPENPHNNRRGNKRRFDDRSRYRQRDYSYKRHRADLEDDQYGRRGSRDEPFDVNLYDDDPASVAARKERADSHSSGDNGRKRPRMTVELLPSKDSGRLRNRSHSPGRDGDGRFGFQESQPCRRTARARSQTPPEVRESRNARNRSRRDELVKELFPNKRTDTPTTNGHRNGGLTELFPKHTPSPSKTPRELFPSHKRQEARDLDSEYKRVAAGMSDYTFDSRDDRRMKALERPGDRERNAKGKHDLFSRMSGTGKSDGRLRAEDDFSFKGAGKSDGGFSILGASDGKGSGDSRLAKELFPMKTGNGGGPRELFDGRIKGRGGQNRRRAEDLI